MPGRDRITSWVHRDLFVELVTAGLPAVFLLLRRRTSFAASALFALPTVQFVLYLRDLLVESVGVV